MFQFIFNQKNKLKVIFIVLAFLSLLFPVNTFAQTQGCLSSNGQYIYFVLDAEGDYRDGVIQYEMNHTSERVLASNQCIKYLGNYGSCYIDNNIGSGSGLGTLVNYGPTNCPIDDHTWALLTFTILPVFFFRKRLFNSIKKK